MYEQVQRRPIKMRSAWWSRKLASGLVQIGISPNQVSVISVAFALIGAILLFVSSLTPKEASATQVILSACCIQLRLLCNMLDGLMAVENGKSSKHGDLFNEFPDRLADVVLLVGAAYACRAGQLAQTLGWLSAVLALGTAYIRAFGARYLPVQDYSGPLAKPQRMFLLTAGSLFCSIEMIMFGTSHSMLITLIVICFGSALTCINRTHHLYKAMEKI